jgi:hypothetical protein
MAQSPHMIASKERETVKLVSWAVNTASRHMFWECRCLAQAMTGKWMLDRRGISSTVYLGLAKDKKKMLTAHAWLRSGDMVLTGHSEMGRHTIVSTFA